MTLTIDFETYGATSLPKHGLYNYTSCPTFTPLCATVIQDNEYGSTNVYTLDFIRDPLAKPTLSRLLEEEKGVPIIAAHNAAFEKAVLRSMGYPVDEYSFIDTAHIARAMGANGSLANAARQLLNEEKYAAGDHLIKLFCIPGELQVRNQSLHFDPEIIDNHLKEWRDMVYTYCHIDTQLAHRLLHMHYNSAYGQLCNDDLDYWNLTQQINEAGWHVDVPAVKRMKERWEENCANIKALHPDLNLNSHKQLVQFCKDRGVNARSFDELNIKKILDRINKKIDTSGSTQELEEVRLLLLHKQELAGSSLKKLDTILDTIEDDNRLRGQYQHFGAGQTGRTSGQGVQLQNLKRLKNPIDMDVLFNPEVELTNAQLAGNIRQVFTAGSNGVILTGDFNAIESRALAWLAGEEWKLTAYREGRGVYEELAARMLNISLEDVDPTARNTGKLGELSGGYGAGPVAVKDFAEKLGTILTESQASAMVNDWRNACPRTVILWSKLRDALFDAVKMDTYTTVEVGPDGTHEKYSVIFEPVATPASLDKRGAASVVMALDVTNGSNFRSTIFSRVFHGVHLVGRDIRYFKPSSNKGGPAWNDTYINPKTKRREHHKLHGGKLAGILTQSMCRELFFSRLKVVNSRVSVTPMMQLVGQFHDEVNIEINPSQEDLTNLGKREFKAFVRSTARWLEEVLSSQSLFTGLPMAASVAYDYRYVK